MSAHLTNQKQENEPKRISKTFIGSSMAHVSPILKNGTASHEKPSKQSPDLSSKRPIHENVILR